MDIWKRIPEELWDQVLKQAADARAARGQIEADIEGARRMAEHRGFSEAQIRTAWEVVRDNERRKSIERAARGRDRARRKDIAADWLRRGLLGVAAAVLLIALIGLGLRVMDHLADAWARGPEANPEDAYPHAQTHLRAAERHFQAHNRPAAKAEAERALTLAPGLVPAQLLIGACCLVDEDHSGAIDAYRRAIRLDPEDPEASLGLATALEAAGRRKEARQWYERTLRNPRSTVAQRDQATRRLAATRG